MQYGVIGHYPEALQILLVNYNRQMLTQLSHSSKHFGKLKKHKSKLKQSGFQFLLQSLDRGKQNCVPNAQINDELRHSVHIDPMLTAPVHSHTLNSSTMIQKNKKGNFFIENVKMLDRSDASISDPFQQNYSKKSKKNKESSYRSKKISKQEQKDSNQHRSNHSAKVERSVLEELINKTKQYLTVAHQTNSKDEINLHRANKKVHRVQSELIALISTIQEEELRQRKPVKLRSSINTTKFSICNSQALKSKGNEEQYLKKINSLQFEKEKLCSLISQHQLANIKMFIKINQGQSEEIQLYKKQLAMLFEKYKKLQAIILSDKRKIDQILREKEQIQLKNKELQLQNTQLIKNLQQYQLEMRNKQSIISQGQKPKKSVNLSLLQPKISHSRQQSYQSNFQNSINERGELCLQSIINSDIESENGFGSSITTITPRILGNKGGRLGINLTALFESMKQQNLGKLMQDPAKLRKMLSECRNSIVSMQNVINQQNKELQYSITALQENQEKLKENQALIKNLEEKISNLSRSLEKERIKYQQKLKQKAKCQQAEVQVKKRANEASFLKNSRAYEQKQVRKKVIVEDNGAVKIDIEGNKGCGDQYRIIALQAKALENMLRRKQI